MPNNPLSSFYRQPKIYLSLPSKGKFYTEGALSGDPMSLPVFGMTAMDEIQLKTPDALFSGESVVSVIKSCIPGIKDPWNMPLIDIDACLVAIRIATYGAKMPMTFDCTSCNEENQIDLDLSSTLEYFLSKDYEDYIFIDPLTVYLRPVTYKEQTVTMLKQYELSKLLAKSYEGMSDEERGKIVTNLLASITDLETTTFKNSIVSVEANDVTVSDKTQINEWINNSDAIFFERIRDHLGKLADVWRVQDQSATCASCGKENKVKINLDYSSFFARH